MSEKRPKIFIVSNATMIICEFLFQSLFYSALIFFWLNHPQMGPIGRKKFLLANPTAAALSVTYPENRRETEFQDFSYICLYISRTVTRTKQTWTSFLQRILRAFDWCVDFYRSSKIVGDIEFFPQKKFEKNRPSLRVGQKKFCSRQGRQ